MIFMKSEIHFFNFLIFVIKHLKMKKNYLHRFTQLKNQNKKLSEENNRVWGYTRVSSKEQLDNYSLENQANSIKRYAEGNNLVLEKVFGGTYESARNDFSRKELQKMFAEVQKSSQKPYAILIYKMSRFSRAGGDGISSLNKLVSNSGVHLIETSTGLTTENKAGELSMLQALVDACRENHNKMEMSLPGMKSFLKQGNWLGRAPRGYDHYGTRVKDLSKIKAEQELIINKEGELLRKAWYWKLNGFKDAEIIKKLNILGLSITKQFLSSMWRKPFYCGIILHNMLDESVEGNWEPLISKNMFWKVQAIIDSNHHGYEQDKENEKAPLTNFLYCSSCKNKMSFYTNKKKRLSYYKCNKCSGMNFNANATKLNKVGAHELFEKTLEKYQLKEDLKPLYKKQLELTFKLINQDMYERKKVINIQLDEIKKRKEKLQERFAFGDIDREIYNKYNEIELKKESNLLIELDEPIFETSNLNNFIEKSLNFCSNLHRNWSLSDTNIKKKIQNVVFQNKIYLNSNKDKYLTDKVNKIFEVISSLSDQYSDNKKGLNNNKIEKSSLVAGAGLEPATFGL